MPVNHEAVGALPVGSAGSKQDLRDLLVRRVPYVLAADEDSQDLVAVDPQSGAVILTLVQNGRVYRLDPDDTTSAHDGETVLVSSEGKRYHLEAAPFPFSVLDKDLTAPPVSPAPAIGDAYLLVNPGTGAWAGLGPIVVLTGRGWVSVELPVGRFVMVEDEDAYYHRDPDNDIDRGLGVSSILDGTLYPSHFLRGGDLVAFIVENQTTATPPGTPGDGDAYVVAATATDDWTGWEGSVARHENGAWVRYEPAEGWRIYDKAQNSNYLFDGTNWVSQAGALVGAGRIFTEGNGSTTAPSHTTAYTYSASTAPTTSQRRRIDDATLSYTARATGNRLRFRYVADVALTINAPGGLSGAGDHVVALYRGSESDAVAWCRLPVPDTLIQTNSTTYNFHIEVEFNVDSDSASARTYRVALHSRYNAGPNFADFAAPTRRHLSVEEFA